MLFYYHQLVQVGISIIHLKNVVRSLSIDSERTCHHTKECECSEENKNQPNKENMSNKDDNATHLNDSHRNEDLELFRRNKTLANAEDVV